MRFFDSVYHCDSILRILKGVLQILVLILKDHDWVIESTKNMLKCNFVYYEEKEENVHIMMNICQSVYMFSNCLSDLLKVFI